MKNLFVCALFLLTFSSLSAQSYRFDHGPYLQELTEDGVTVVFSTSGKGFSWIDLKERDGKVTRHYAGRNGLRHAYATFNAIRLDGLKPAAEYEYRLGSKAIADFQPYKVTFGDSIASTWHTFETPDPKALRCSFVALSDMHGDAAKLGRLLTLADVGSADRVFYVGDMMNYYDNEQAAYDGFIDKSVELFATQRPFVVVRGNHETRGSKAREYDRFVPGNGGKYYGACRIGDVMFVMLDCGEDKPDDFWVYAGLTDFDAYRSEQARWFAGLIDSKAYKSARWHIVMNHFPPALEPDDNPEMHGPLDFTAKFLPLYNRAKIDLMFSGHTHRYEFMEPTAGMRFPVIVGSTESISRVDIDGRTMKVNVLDTGNNVLKEFTIEK